MPATFEAAFARVKQLVADFRANEKFYRSPAYQEQEARRDFIDKFWLALGWDVNHETQKNPFEQEVKVERGLSLSASDGERDGVRGRTSVPWPMPSQARASGVVRPWSKPRALGATSLVWLSMLYPPSAIFFGCGVA